MTRSHAIKKATSNHWIQGAVKHPGSFTRTAKEHGKSVHEEAEEDKGKKGKEGRRARLALVFEKMNKHRKKENK